ncbi:ribosomal protein S18-alanine N-acetyltransferase [Corallincola platygyrae]|uniref:[Ribosomal protein bS18]-alanine N-acetyltransferase n=1 Tax=Corallincola platygyrae TaxID=1193278 RepID=A0ABW4XTS6_9GAMM
MSIRELQATDLARVIEIEHRCHSHPAAESIIAQSLSGQDLTYGIELDNTIVGFYLASVVLDELTVTDIAVIPEAQGNGFGRKLLTHLLDHAEQNGVKHLFLEVRASNVSAQGLYLSEGFNQLGVRKNYYPAAEGREDALVMGLSLAM